MFSDRSRQEHYSSRRPYNVGQLTLTENWKSLFARKAPVWKMGEKIVRGAGCEKKWTVVLLFKRTFGQN